LAERLKDDLLREKAILFQELQHRVANSLQIIASILMQSARRMPSAETRTYLFDAHSLVMSVAALQQQLSASKLEDVELHSYFTELCDSIGASMIPDHEKLKLEVKAEAGLATVDVSVSLGLIVTELMINARGSDWTLSVSDGGVGMPGGLSASQSRPRHQHRRGPGQTARRKGQLRRSQSWDQRLDRARSGGRWRRSNPPGPADLASQTGRPSA
jgi:hypothetical protein